MKYIFVILVLASCGVKKGTPIERIKDPVTPVGKLANYLMDMQMGAGSTFHCTDDGICDVRYVEHGERIMMQVDCSGNQCKAIAEKTAIEVDFR